MITCILRFVAFYKTDILSDPTWYSIELIIWTTAESGLYLIAACLPSLRSLVPLIIKHQYILIFRTKFSAYHSKLFSQNTTGSHTNHVEQAKQQQHEDSEKTSSATTTTTRIGSNHRLGKWARSERRGEPTSSAEDSSLEVEVLTTCYRENSSSRTLDMRNDDLDVNVDVERGLVGDGIRIERGFYVSTDAR